MALSDSVPVYRDAIQPAAVEVGKAAGTIGKAVNVALAPLRLVIWGYDQIETFLVNRVSEELKDVPPERVVTPDLTIAGPAVEALKFAGHKKDLRDIYARLLAKSMDIDSSSAAHPAFVEVIKQMTSDEAKVLTFVWKVENIPVVDLRVSRTASGEDGARVGSFEERLRNLSTVGSQSGCVHPDLTPSYLDNLERLKLINLRDLVISKYEYYEAIDQREELTALVSSIDSDPNRKAEFKRRIASITEFGKQFCTICIGNHSPEIDA